MTPKKKKIYTVIIMIQAIVIVSLTGWIGKGVWDHYQGSKRQYTPPTVTVESTPVELGDFETFITAVGTLKANEAIMLRPQDGGVVKEILFESGTYVKKGQVLLRLDDAVLKAQLAEAEAKLGSAKADYDRAHALFKQKAAPKSKLDETMGVYKRMEAEVAFNQAKLEQSVLRAPFSGFVGLKDVSVGSYLKPGEDIVSLDSADPIKVDFRISETHIDRLKVTQEVEVTVEGFPDHIYTAIIEAIDPVVDETGHSIRVRAVFDNKDQLLKPGLFSRVRFSNISHKDVMVVPEGAVETEGNEEYVYVVLDGVAHKASIKTGARNGKEVEVRSGLTTGTMVVTSGHLRVQEGTPVIVVPVHETQGY